MDLLGVRQLPLQAGAMDADAGVRFVKHALLEEATSAPSEAWHA